MGCLVDMAERTMVVTLNGEVLFNDRGSELAARDFDARDGLEEFLFFIYCIALTYCNNVCLTDNK